MKIEKLREILPESRYHNVRRFTEDQGAQKACFLAEEGRKGRKRTVFITAEKTPDNEAAKMLSKRGYSLGNEIAIALGLPVDEAVKHGILSLTDFMEKDGEVIAVQPYFRSKSLRRKVKEEGPLTKKEFSKIIPQTLRATAYLHEKGLGHRDLNPGNILIGENLETRVGDLATAASLDRESSEIISTGGRSVRDPLYGKELEGTIAQNDVYSLAMDALFGLRGAIPVHYDFITGTGIDTSTGESIVNAEGKPIPTKHNATIDQALTLIPKWARKRRIDRVLGRALKFGNRYNGLNEFEADLNKALKPNWRDRFKSLKTKAKVAIVGGLAALVVLTGTGIGLSAYGLNRNRKAELKHQAEIVDAQKYLVKSEWNGNPLEIENNLCNIELKAYIKGKWTNSFPNIRFLRAAPSDEIDFYAEARETAWPRKSSIMLPYFPVQVYMDGIPITCESHITLSQSTKGSVNSYAHPIDFNRAVVYDMGGPQALNVSLVIPTNIPNGVYYLSAAMYPPEKVDKSYNQDPKFNSRINAISLKRIPIVVGEKTDAIYMNELCIDNYYDHATFARLGEEGIFRRENDSKYKIAFSISEEGEPKFIDFDDYFRFSLPRGTNTSSRTLQIAVFNELGEIINYNSTPIERWQIANNSSYDWRFGQITRDFPDKAIKERQKLAEQIKNYCRTNVAYSLPKE